MSDLPPFFQVHSGLDREGPGCPADVAWALGQVDLLAKARVCDAGCGPGADTVTLAELMPEARIDAVDKFAHFVDEAQQRVRRFGPRVQVRQGDMAALGAPYDLIWCAGALYFLGVTEGLLTWRTALAPGGTIVFSEPCLPDGPVSPAVRDFWAEYPQATDLAGIESRVTAAGFEVIATRQIVGAPWEAYYTPMQAKIDVLRAQADPALTEVLDECQREIDLWRAASDQVAYALLVVRPKG